MIKIILAIAVPIIILIAFWCLVVPYSNKEQKKEEYDSWIFKSKLHTKSEGLIVTLDWHTVLSLYAVNPERWYFYDSNMISYRTDEAKVYTILLSYDDYLLYMAWQEEKKQEERYRRKFQKGRRYY